LPRYFIPFCRAMLCISAAIAVMRCPSVCLSVCPSVTFVDHVKTNKNIFEIFSPSGNHTILVCPYQTGWWYSDGNPPPLMGASNARGYEKWRFSINILLYIRNAATESHTYYERRIGDRMQAFEWYHFEWSWVTSDPDFKVTLSFKYVRILCHKAHTW